jgi:hypothetical protein
MGGTGDESGACCGFSLCCPVTVLGQFFPDLFLAVTSTKPRRPRVAPRSMASIRRRERALAIDTTTITERSSCLVNPPRRSFTKPSAVYENTIGPLRGAQGRDAGAGSGVPSAIVLRRRARPPIPGPFRGWCRARSTRRRPVAPNWRGSRCYCRWCAGRRPASQPRRRAASSRPGAGVTVVIDRPPLASRGPVPQPAPGRPKPGVPAPGRGRAGRYRSTSARRGRQRGCGLDNASSYLDVLGTPAADGSYAGCGLPVGADGAGGQPPNVLTLCCGAARGCASR